jgi:hypothetical protein
MDQLGFLIALIAIGAVGFVMARAWRKDPPKL